jgi:hypothetical protein
MLTTPQWVLIPASPQPGEPGPITIRNTEDAPTHWPVCVIPGSLGQRSPGGEVVRLFDEDDIAAAKLIAIAPEMHRALQALVRWAGYTGGWDAPCWQEAERVLAEAEAAQSLTGEP